MMTIQLFRAQIEATAATHDLDVILSNCRVKELACALGSPSESSALINLRILKYPYVTGNPTLDLAQGSVCFKYEPITWSGDIKLEGPDL